MHAQHSQRNTRTNPRDGEHHIEHFTFGGFSETVERHRFFAHNHAGEHRGSLPQVQASERTGGGVHKHPKPVDVEDDAVETYMVYSAGE